MAPREGTVRNDQHRAESDRPRRQPAGPADLYRHDQDAAHDTVRRRLDEGACIIDDGEASKLSYAKYVTKRLSGFTLEPALI
jgi:ribosomal protein L25 (general stress protein Ctc)